MPGGIAGRVQGIPLFLYGFGIISGLCLSVMFGPFLLARCAPHHLVDIALDRLQLPDTLFFLPVIVVPGVLVGG